MILHRAEILEDARDVARAANTGRRSKHRVVPPESATVVERAANTDRSEKRAVLTECARM